MSHKQWLFIVCILLMPVPANCDDWPMWRRDAGRQACTAEALPESLALRWTRQLPPLKPAFHNARLQFDAGYEPVVVGDRLLVASSVTDSVTAYDAATGEQEWIYRTNGPVRFSPAIWQQSVCFGSDDGYLYCVDLASGKLRWKHRAVPSDRRLLGNGRLISVWPVRGGPVVADGNVYFAAGVWPFEGVFVYAIDIVSGDVQWRNDRLGYLFGQQPHNTQAIGGLAPQGYLVVHDDELIVPCSTAYPARLNRKTGELIEFELPAPGRLPGGWFAALDPDTARAIRRGKLAFDDVINSQLHEDKIHKGAGVSGLSRTIRVGQQDLSFDDPIDGVAGTIHSIVIAGRRQYVSTREGMIYCFAGTASSQTQPPRTWSSSTTDLTATKQSLETATKIIERSSAPYGYVFVLGLNDGSLVKSLLMKSNYHVIAIDADAVAVDRLRTELIEAGLYGSAASVMLADPRAVSLPKYIATLITTETPEHMADAWSAILPSLRPFGGIAALRIEVDSQLEETVKSLATNNFDLHNISGHGFVKRTGALPEASDYAGDYAENPDPLVRFPLGVLWFDDTLAHFKRSPQPQFHGGVMISRPKDWHAPRVKGDYSVDYPLLPAVLSDIYTGRVLDSNEQPEIRTAQTAEGGKLPQQSYYHAPHQKTALNPDPPVAGQRRNPLTGLTETRAFPKMYGCDGGVDYGRLYTLRSGTAAFYDKSIESGTVFLSGPRSGCTNSIIPSGGLLNVPYFYEGCTCSYPLPTGMSLVAMPESHEQWSSWGDSEIEPQSIQRIGLNFGAPGDRVTREGTLWLDYPSVGGPSPQVRVTTDPAIPTYHYRHSIWIQGGDAWPWVVASACEGLRQITLEDLKPGYYIARLFFAEFDQTQVGQRLQRIAIGDRTILDNFDIAERAAGAMRGIVYQTENIKVSDDGTWTLKLTATTGTTLISGIELIRQPQDDAD